MNARKWTTIATLTVVGTLAVGATASASEGDSGTPGSGARSTKVCDNLDQINERLADRLAEVARRTESLTTRRAEAVEAGRDRVVARIDLALTRLADRATRLQERVDELADWATEHCTTVG